MDGKMIVAGVIVVAVFGGGGFWAGMTYAAQNGGDSSSRAAQGNFAGRGGRFQNGGNAFGTIASIAGGTLTIELMSGPNASSTASTGSGQAGQTGTGSKIVLYDPSTHIGKFTTGTVSDLKVGDNVVVIGTSNPDDSITAQMIQIRPAGMDFGLPGHDGSRGNHGATPPQGQ